MARVGRGVRFASPAALIAFGFFLWPSVATAIEFGIPTTPAGIDCSGLSGIIADLDPGFTVTLKNCSGDTARSLLELAFSTPGQTPSTSTYASDALLVTLSHEQETTCQVTGVSGGGLNVVGISITTARVPANGEPMARLIGEPIILQRFEDPNSTSKVTLTDAVVAQLDGEFSHRSLINPSGMPPGETGATCGIWGDESEAYLEYRGAEQLRGVFTGKFICAKPVNNELTDPTPCRATALRAATTFLNVGPETCVSLSANAESSAGFHDCCDPMIGVQDPAKWTMQCTRVIITEMMTSQGWQTLDPFYWSADKLDLDPSDTNNEPPELSLAEFACFDFADPTPYLTDPADCPESSLYCDLDDDGVFDVCDHYVSTAGTPQGGTINIKNKLRNRMFNDQGPGFTQFTENHR